MTYALRQQFQEMDRAVQSDERQKLADLAATQKRADEANQRRINAQAMPANFDMPGGYQFGSANAAPAPQTGAPGQATGGGEAYVGRKPRGAVQQYVNTPDQSDAESKRLSRTQEDPGLAALRNIRRAQLSGSKTDPAEEAAYSEYVKRQRSAGWPATPSAGGTDQAAYAELKQKNAQFSPQRVGTPGAPVPTAATPTAAPATSFIDRVRQAESAGNPNAVGKYIPGQGTAKGDMQVMDATNLNPGFGVTPARNTSPEERSRVGRDYAQALLNRYGNEADAAAAYNWGPGNFDQWVASGRNPAQMPAETRNYIAKIAGGQPAAGAPTQAAQAPAQPEVTYSGMGPGGSPQMLNEQIQLSQWRYNQLAQLLQHAPPEQQEKIGAEMRTLHAGVRAQQAYMLAAQSDANPQALGQLVALAGAQAARTQDGRYVLVDNAGKPISQPVTGGQLGAYLFRAMDEKSRAAQADMQGKIALEQAKAAAKAQGTLVEQGGTGAELEALRSYYRMMEEQAKPQGYAAISDPMKGGITIYNKGTGQPLQIPQVPNMVTPN